MKKARVTFEDMKEEIRDVSDLFLLNFVKKLYIYINASNMAIDAVLTQKNEENDISLFYILRQLSAAENNYMVVEKECLTIVSAVKKLKIHLTKKFTIRTDHQACKWLLGL